MGMMLPYALYQCRSGLCGYWFPNASAAHDDSWIMSIASISFKAFPFRMPIYSGAILQGYHFISALIIYVVSLSGIPMQTIFYGIIPLIWFFLITKILFTLSHSISKNNTFKFIFIFLFFFGGSFSYLMLLYHKLPLFYPYVMTGRQAVDYFQSMPLALSLIPFLLSIYYLYINKKLSFNTKILFLVGTVFFAWGSKFYGGFATAVMLLTYECIELLKSKNKSNLILLSTVAITSVLSVLFFYNPFGNMGSAERTFIFSPFAIVHSLIEEKNLIYLPNLVNARYYLHAHGGWGPRLLAIEAFTWILYVIYTFGIRIIGFVYLAIQLLRKKISVIDISLITSVIACLFGGTMFVQRAEWWNAGQFLDYPKIILSIYTALGVAALLERKKPAFKIGLIVLVLLLSVYNSVHGFIERFTYGQALVLSNNQINALTILKKLPSGTIFTLPFDRFKPSTSKKVEDNIDTVYVPIISKKEMYYSTPHQLDLTFTDYSRRKNVIDKNLFTHPNLIDADYFYINKSNDLYNKTKFDSEYFIKLYENNDVVIFKRIDRK